MSTFPNDPTAQPEPYTPKPGDKVRSTSDLGALLDVNDSKFVGTWPAGRTGVVLGQHPAPALRQWSIVAVAAADVVPGDDQADGLLAAGRLFVPVGPGHVAKIDDEAGDR